MTKIRSFFKTSFGSALVGGVIVALAGWLAIAAGWIESGNDQTSTATVSSTPLAGTADSTPSSDKGLSVGQIYQQDAPGVVHIEAVSPASDTPFGFGGQQGSTATGSGFVIDNQGRIITNAHVVSGANSIQVTAGDQGNSVKADLVGEDLSTDVALLKVDPGKIDLHPLTLGDSGNVKVGAPVVAIGNPFGLDRTVTTGIVSALQRQIQAPNGFSISDVIQTDAAINPGNSGGPLIDSKGRVIGITSQIATDGGGGSVGIGFAVPINTAHDVAQQLEDNGKVSRAYLGITGTDLNSQIAKAVNLDRTDGALIQKVQSGGPADKAGLEGGSATITLGNGQTVSVGGDIIIEANGKKVTGMDDVISVVNGLKPGDDLRLTIVRGGDEKQVTVKLGNRPARVNSNG